MLGLLFGTLFGCLFLSVPIGTCLALSSLVVILKGYPSSMITLLAQATVTAVDQYALMAIPFFMLLGILMEKAGIAQSLVGAAGKLVGSSAGGLGNTAVVACMFFAAISGSGPATVAAIGTIIIPSMIRQGYGNDYCGALLASGATIGPVIPPSIPMIMYGATVGVSVSALFAAGIIPGILMGVALMILNVLVSKKRNYRGEKTKGKNKGVAWALAMPIIVLGGIYGGIFTPTEAAVVGVFYAAAVGVFVFRALSVKKYLDGLVEGAVLSATVMFVMGGANTLGKILTLEQVPQKIATFLRTVSDSPVVIMLMINVVLLLAGMFIDTISSIILLSPLFCPIVSSLGYDLVYFGIIMTVNLCIGFLTPPLGGNLFVAQNICGGTFEGILKEVWPMIIVLLVVLVLLIVFPGISLCIPRLLHLIV